MVVATSETLPHSDTDLLHALTETLKENWFSHNFQQVVSKKVDNELIVI